MEKKRVFIVNSVYLSLLTLAFISIYVVFTNVFRLSFLQNFLILLIFIAAYLILFKIIWNVRKSFLFLDNLLLEPEKQKFEMIPEVNDPIVDEIIKEITVEESKPVPKKKAPSRKYKFYGSTDAMSYHKESCRFSGMIKKKYLVKKNNKDYFKKNKFKACGTCKPDKK